MVQLSIEHSGLIWDCHIGTEHSRPFTIQYIKNKLVGYWHCAEMDLRNYFLPESEYMLSLVENLMMRKM